MRSAFELYGFDYNRVGKRTEIPVNYSCLVWTNTSFDELGINVPFMKTVRSRKRKIVNEGSEGAVVVDNVGEVAFGVVYQPDVIGYHPQNHDDDTNKSDMSLSPPAFSNGSDDDSFAVAIDVLRDYGAHDSQAQAGETSDFSEIGYELYCVFI